MFVHFINKIYREFPIFLLVHNRLLCRMKNDVDVKFKNSLCALALFFSISIFPLIAFSQWTLYNELDCGFTLTLTCNDDGSRFSFSSSANPTEASWGSPSTISLPNVKCQCTDMNITLQSDRTSTNLSFSLHDYKNYISQGGDPNDFTNPSNHYIFCCCDNCTWKHPCDVQNGCGAIIIDALNCSITIQKPASPFCP